jgi:hypothetical protein
MLSTGDRCFLKPVKHDLSRARSLRRNLHSSRGLLRLARTVPRFNRSTELLTFTKLIFRAGAHVAAEDARLAASVPASRQPRLFIHLPDEVS